MVVFPLADWFRLDDRVKLDDEAYIYGLIDPRDRRIRYVGKTSKPVKVRCLEHFVEPTNRYMRAWIDQLRAAGIVPDVVVLEIVSSSSWEEAEKKWIARMWDLGDLLNVHPGGRVNPRKHDHRKMSKRKREARERAALSGPVKILTREEIGSLYGEKQAPMQTARTRQSLERKALLPLVTLRRVRGGGVVDSGVPAHSAEVGQVDDRSCRQQTPACAVVPEQSAN